MVGIMKLWTSLPVIFLCMALLSVLGAIRKKPVPGEKTRILECWGGPNAQDCTKKCSRALRCRNVSEACCWTYCGNICWKNRNPYASHQKP
ncbi:protein WFDC11 [Rousettus aegyptiacus]|uniref:WAP four-disulfide core domain 11 n=1 Tax=Rousettus aegyptiacus TaxID=9407 RepID=A0A7J8DLU3_ROUAE|nr:protein WFDC11 [Rousettus aegyptiacus]KAF6424217.1 WAP four-disulfide core domain 11 [Rousettus aegyptiacus]